MRLCFGHTKNIETRSSNDKGAIKREPWFLWNLIGMSVVLF